MTAKPAPGAESTAIATASQVTGITLGTAEVAHGATPLARVTTPSITTLVAGGSNEPCSWVVVIVDDCVFASGCAGAGPFAFANVATVPAQHSVSMVVGIPSPLALTQTTALVIGGVVENVGNVWEVTGADRWRSTVFDASIGCSSSFVPSYPKTAA